MSLLASRSLSLKRETSFPLIFEILMSIYFLSIKQSFFYDESFEDYSEALYEGGKQTVDDSGLKTKELIMELELSLDVEDIKNEIPFYEKMLQDLANSSQNVKNELEKSEQAPPIE